jgi:hypothetical protein
VHHSFPYCNCAKELWDWADPSSQNNAQGLEDWTEWLITTKKGGGYY